MIQFRIVKVSRHKSSELRTYHFTYKDGDRQDKKTEGAEWEEVEFTINADEKPRIGVGNIEGDGYLVGSPNKLILNHPDLFGTYKVGDLISFIPAIVVSSEN
jgi:hypothetical protein